MVSASRQTECHTLSAAADAKDLRPCSSTRFFLPPVFFCLGTRSLSFIYLYSLPHFCSRPFTHSSVSCLEPSQYHHHCCSPFSVSYQISISFSPGPRLQTSVLVSVSLLMVLRFAVKCVGGEKNLFSVKKK